jgi:hypothetical protein
MNDNHDEPQKAENVLEAVSLMLMLTGKIAEQFRVCPVCLAHMVSEAVANAEEAGAVHHMDDDDGRTIDGTTTVQ